ncbi:hypothetical protein OESDEN_18005 [Oesophagostomum dentatum]|uniref:Uncharacterized protein n=1 Tax=Oesophagostomum dentatum TaxID=61180 RepID=A0A0B1SFH8_OESDE|nr:hypothetical protein OESDEN_18005 [Oesophagostomum dentatum]
MGCRNSLDVFVRYSCLRHLLPSSEVSVDLRRAQLSSKSYLSRRKMLAELCDDNDILMILKQHRLDFPVSCNG